MPPPTTGGRVGRITSHPDARRFMLVCATLAFAHTFAAEFLAGPYLVYEVLVEGPAPADGAVWCAPFARVVRQVYPSPVRSPLRYQTALRSAVLQHSGAPPVPGTETLLSTPSLARHPAHLPGMNENTTAAHIALAPVDMQRVTTKTRRDGFTPADPAQPGLFNLPARTVACPLRSSISAQRIGAVISSARLGFYSGVLVG